MKKTFISLFFSLFITIAFAQIDSNKVWNEINSLKSQSKFLQKEILHLKDSVSFQKTLIDSIKENVALNTENIQTTAKGLDIKIKDSATESDKKYTDIDKSISKNVLYFIIAFLLLIIVSFLVYVFLIKKLKSNKSEVFEKINSTMKVYEEEQIKLFTKLAEINNNQLDLLKIQNINNKPGQELDHSLALRVADNIVKIQMNLSIMDSKTIGHRQLVQLVNQVIDNFKANKYEIIDMLGKPYHQGMNVTPTMMLDENLKPGEMIIKQIIKPQVNYDGQLIQAAQVKVAYGE